MLTKKLFFELVHFFPSTFGYEKSYTFHADMPSYEAVGNDDDDNQNDLKSFLENIFYVQFFYTTSQCVT